MKLPPLPIVVLDTETTGFVPRTHRVIEYASVTVVDGAVTDTYEQLIACDDIPPAVEVLTRIRAEDLRGRPDFAACREEILRRIPEDAILVGQNIPYDLGMLKGEDLDLTGRPWIDTSMLASLVFPELESYSLGYLSAVLALDHEPKHRALGDVRATLALLARVWERLLELPEEMRAEARSIMERAPAGYRRLFAALPAGKNAAVPSWLSPAPQASFGRRALHAQTLKVPQRGTPVLREESLDPAELQTIIEASHGESSSHPTVRTWIAVKNIDASVRRLTAHQNVAAIYPPSHLLDPSAVRRLETAEALTADEATLLTKIRWYSSTHPSSPLFPGGRGAGGGGILRGGGAGGEGKKIEAPFTRNDLPLHGGEESVWRGTLACTEASPAYAGQFTDLPGTVLIDHRHLLHLLQNPDHPAASALAEPAHVVIDDASMLEDTATKAFGWYCDVSALRAGSERHAALTRVTDLLQLWIEKIRGGLDVRAITANDLTAPEAKGLRTQIDELLGGDASLPAPVREQLSNIACILDPDNLARRYAYIEQRMNGSHTLQSVPEHVGDFLADALFSRFPATLLVPPGSAEELREILPHGSAADVERLSGTPKIPVAFPLTPVHDIVANPPPGKSIILIPGKGTIENMYVKYAEQLEERGVTMVCLGVSGGQGRMRAEFLAAKAPAVWLVTPWVFEGLELPPDSVDHLVLSALPFDYASHPVLSRRAARYRSGFADYFLPRLTHRLFRVLRTFARFRTAEGDVAILDDRLRSKDYGKSVIAYLGRFSSPATDTADSSIKPSSDTPASVPKKRKSTKEKTAAPQLKLF